MRAEARYNPCGQATAVAVSPAPLPVPNDPGCNDLVGDLWLEWPAKAMDALSAWSLYPGRYFDAQIGPPTPRLSP